MKIVGILGSPRKGWNSQQLLESALEGAHEQGAETELYFLGEGIFRGCNSCFACKVKASQAAGGLCVLQDDLRPILKSSLEADGLILASPIYLGDVSSGMRAYMERLLFPMVSYEKNRKSFFEGHIETAFLFSMGLPEEDALARRYDLIYANQERYLKLLGGDCKILASYDSMQFEDYSKMAASKYNPIDKARIRNDVFPKDLERARRLGQGMTLELFTRKKEKL